MSQFLDIFSARYGKGGGSCQNIRTEFLSQQNSPGNCSRSLCPKGREEIKIPAQEHHRKRALEHLRSQSKVKPQFLRQPQIKLHKTSSIQHNQDRELRSTSHVIQQLLVIKRENEDDETKALRFLTKTFPQERTKRHIFPSLDISCCLHQILISMALVRTKDLKTEK